MAANACRSRLVQLAATASAGGGRCRRPRPGDADPAARDRRPGRDRGSAGESGLALEIVEATAPDIVVVDPRLPEIEAGLEFIRRLRAVAPAVRVVVMGGSPRWGRSPVAADRCCTSPRGACTARRARWRTLRAAGASSSCRASWPDGGRRSRSRAATATSCRARALLTRGGWWRNGGHRHPADSGASPSVPRHAGAARRHPVGHVHAARAFSARMGHEPARAVGRGRAVLMASSRRRWAR